MAKQMDLAYLNSGHTANMQLQLEKRAQKAENYKKRMVKEGQQRLAFGYSFMNNSSESEYLAYMKNRCEDARLNKKLENIVKQQTVTQRLISKQIQSTKIRSERFINDASRSLQPKRRASAPAKMRSNCEQTTLTSRLQALQFNRCKSVNLPIANVALYLQHIENSNEADILENVESGEQKMQSGCVRFEEISDKCDTEHCKRTTNKLPGIGPIKVGPRGKSSLKHYSDAKTVPNTSSACQSKPINKTPTLPCPFSQQRAHERGGNGEQCANDNDDDDLSRLHEEDKLELKLRRFMDAQIRMNNGNPVSDDVKDEHEKVRFISSSSTRLRPKQAWIVKEARRTLGLME